MSASLHTLEELNFDNSYTDFPAHFFQPKQPEPLTDPFLISFNPEVAKLLDLDPCQAQPEALAYYFGGEGLLPGSEPLAMKYTGHQFGYYNPDLGDGRGLLLGEVLNSQGERWDLHLKGAGKTAFSRFGDGRAVLRSSIREYLISEAMHGLGIPTTRALSLVGSRDQVMREGMMEPCAAVLRVTRCHIRFGHFEWLYYSKRHEDLKLLADYAIERYFPSLQQAENPYAAMFSEVLQRSASLVAQWQCYGFVHAVLNTDNMSLLGETFDYGPFSFMDSYNPDLVSNHNDDQARYAFARQPAIVQWNLACLAQALLPLIPREYLEAELERFPGLYQAAELTLMRRRLGLQQEHEGDRSLLEQLKTLFTAQQVDMTRFFRQLSYFDDSEPSLEPLFGLISTPSALSDWLRLYRQRLMQEQCSEAERKAAMLAVNPRLILRNYMAEEAIRAAHEGDFEPVSQLMGLLRDPFAEVAGDERYCKAPPQWAAAICLTCSS
ncbi:protein adenylyltransferase SelO [Marinobacterium jannaschii]|uniref:protein adenylyltransferase SelO n=1 Tax=Marinobacterium jannaschii TaxID=64970 RepID=UPI000489D801|nr:YdiU family protein [Marinobacterium jannaschii]